MFDRAAYGCRLFCCWCAQDIEANRFWESLGFIPLAFRAGSRGKGRVHIFWQKRIREGDAATPWWYPTTTNGGSIREDRLVFPIPPGKHWSDEMPRVLPSENRKIDAPGARQIAGHRVVGKRKSQIANRKHFSLSRSKFCFAGPKPADAKPPRTKREKLKHDPALVAKARELNGRWLELINSDPNALPDSQPRYHLVKQIEAPAAKSKPVDLLEAA
jgi:hypothetical protein